MTHSEVWAGFCSIYSLWTLYDVSLEVGLTGPQSLTTQRTFWHRLHRLFKKWEEVSQKWHQAFSGGRPSPTTKLFGLLKSTRGSVLSYYFVQAFRDALQAQKAQSRLKIPQERKPFCGVVTTGKLWLSPSLCA